MADTSKPDQELTSGGEDLPPSTKEKPPDVVIEQENESEKDGSAVSTASGKNSIVT